MRVLFNLKIRQEFRKFIEYCYVFGKFEILEQFSSLGSLSSCEKNINLTMDAMQIHVSSLEGLYSELILK